jgi:hypothetical protein
MNTREKVGPAPAIQEDNYPCAKPRLQSQKLDKTAAPCYVEVRDERATDAQADFR